MPSLEDFLGGATRDTALGVLCESPKGLAMLLRSAVEVFFPVGRLRRLALLLIVGALMQVTMILNTDEWMYLYAVN